MPIHEIATLLSETNLGVGTHYSDAKTVLMPGYAIQTQWSGTVTGTIGLQGRLSEDFGWVDLDGTEYAIADDSRLYNLREQHYTEVRAKLVVATGSADTFKVGYCCKAMY